MEASPTASDNSFSVQQSSLLAHGQANLRDLTNPGIFLLGQNNETKQHIGDKIHLEVHNLNLSLQTPNEASTQNKDPAGRGGEACQEVNTKLSEKLTSYVRRVHEYVGKKKSPLPPKLCVNIGIVPFQVSNQDQDYTKIDKFKRDEALEFYDNALTDSSSLDIKELFKKAKDLAIKKAKSSNITEQAGEKDILRYGNVVWITGRAGIGKTTLTKEVTLKALVKKSYDFVFYIPFRDIDNIENSGDLLQFLTNDYKFLNDAKAETRRKCLEELQKSDNVLIVMDGFDEAEEMEIRLKMSTQLKNDTDALFYGNLQAKLFLKSILHGNILPNAKKLITSRPGPLLQMHEDYTPIFEVNLLGIGLNAQQDICQDIASNFDDGEEPVTEERKEQIKQRKEQIISFLENHKDLRSYCYVPAICIIIMYCIDANCQDNQRNSEENKENLDTLTSILVQALMRFIKGGHLRNKKTQKTKGKKDAAEQEFQIEKLCELAYNCYVDNRYHFTFAELEEIGINDDNAAAFFAIGKSKMRLFEKGHQRYYFTHLILQELCVAMHIKLYMEEKEFEKDNSVTTKLDSDKYQVVTKLLFGLCNKSTWKYLQGLPEEVCCQKLDESRNYEDSASIKFLKQLVRKHVPTFSGSATKKNVISAFHICSWLHEMRDEHFTKQIVNESLNNNKLVITGDILPSDVSGFYYMLHWRKEPIALSVVAPSFSKEALASFFDEMKKTTNLRFSKLKFKSDNIGDEGVTSIAKCIRKIDQLYLVACPLKVDGLKNLSAAIQQLPESLERLDLCAIPIDDGGAEQLKGCISKIRNVKLQLCQLKVPGIKLLAQGIQGNQLTELNLSEGAIEDEGAKWLAPCVPFVRRLILKFCNLSSEGVGYLSEYIEQNQLELLDLSENVIENRGAELLAKCISNIDRLILEYCYIDADGAKALAEALCSKNTPMEELYLLNNKIGDRGFEAMSTCVTKIRKLSIGDCNDMYLSFNGVKKFAEQLKSSASLPMKDLSLCCRRGYEKQAKDLLSGLRGVKISFQNSSLSGN